MLTKRNIPYADETEIQLPDEGWWASVLADEEGYRTVYKEPGTKPVTVAAHVSVDWDYVRTLFEQDEIINLQVHGYNRGGLLVTGQGLQGFVPISHLVDLPNGACEEERKDILVGYVGRFLDLKVIECEPEMERVVFSERAALAGEGRRKSLFRALHPNDTITGTVTNVTDFGVFVDLGGLEGLIHVSELSWGRVQHPNDILKVGDEVMALVLQVSQENGRVALSLKRLSQNPWDHLEERYTPGDEVSAVITGVARFGAFARLEDGIEGLIHISSINDCINHHEIGKNIKPGQHVLVRILHMEAEKRRLGLNLISLE